MPLSSGSPRKTRLTSDMDPVKEDIVIICHRCLDFKPLWDVKEEPPEDSVLHKCHGRIYKRFDNTWMAEGYLTTETDAEFVMKANLQGYLPLIPVDKNGNIDVPSIYGSSVICVVDDGDFKRLKVFDPATDSNKKGWYDK